MVNRVKGFWHIKKNYTNKEAFIQSIKPIISTSEEGGGSGVFSYKFRLQRVDEVINHKMTIELSPNHLFNRFATNGQ